MKKFHEILLNHAYALIFILCSSPHAPPWVQKNYGNEVAVSYCLVILIMSFVIFGFITWWFMSTWLSPRPARMAMIYFSSVLGLIISIPALLAIYGIISPNIYFWWREIPTYILFLLVGIFAVIDVVQSAE